MERSTAPAHSVSAVLRSLSPKDIPHSRAFLHACDYQQLDLFLKMAEAPIGTTFHCPLERISTNQSYSQSSMEELGSSRLGMLLRYVLFETVHLTSIT